MVKPQQITIGAASAPYGNRIYFRSWLAVLLGFNPYSYRYFQVPLLKLSFLEPLPLAVEYNNFLPFQQHFLLQYIPKYHQVPGEQLP